MLMENNTKVIKQLKKLSHSVNDFESLQPLFDAVEDKSYVLLGEASHGTHEYYVWRQEISKKLITDYGFTFIAVEGDWPDCYRVNRFIKGYPEGGISAYEVLHGFNRWPTWMWANWEMVEFVDWLQKYNNDLPEEKKVGFYGLDVYSLWDSLRAIITFLKKNDPEAIDAAIKAYLCFEPYNEDPHKYAKATMFVPKSCEDEVVSLLKTLQQSNQKYNGDREAFFNAEQNAIVLKNAERYYRTMIHGGANSWNIRDTHMVETLERLREFHGKDAKGIVWAHNTHIGDARYTDMHEVGEVNIGQLVREQHGEEQVSLVGFSTYNGNVIASVAWDEPMKKMPVPKALPGSWDAIFHESSPNDQLLLFTSTDIPKEFMEVRGQRAIGVVYIPEHEFGNYVPTVLSKRYDGLLFFDTTHALSPLHIEEAKDEDFPETYPWGV